MCCTWMRQHSLGSTSVVIQNIVAAGVASDGLPGQMRPIPGGCGFAEDPSQDARAVHPVWLVDPPSVVRVIGDANANADADACLSIWRIPGSKQIVHDGKQVRLTSTRGTEIHRLTWPSELVEGDPFAFAISSGFDLRVQWNAISGFTEYLKADLPAHRVARVFPPSRSSQVHMRMLQALDGSFAGASQRDIAAALFGAAAVKRQWYSDSELRAQVRHLIRKGRALMLGEYRRLLQSSPKRKGDREVLAKSP